jgi:hypothetical protein
MPQLFIPDKNRSLYEKINHLDNLEVISVLLAFVQNIKGMKLIKTCGNVN